MSTTPASQTVLFRFQTPLVGGDLAQVNAGVLYEGIYSGLIATSGGGAVINVSAGVCLIFDAASYGTPAAKMVKVAFGANFSYTMDSGLKHRYLVISFTWADSTTNYATVSDTDTPLASDIILCAVEWSGSVVSLVDTASATMGFRGKFDGVVNNLAPTADPLNSRTVKIAAGRFVYSHSSTSYAGGSTQLDAAVSSTRYDLVGLDSSGTVVVIKGTEGGGQPPFTTMLPVAIVQVRVGVSSFLQSDILDVRPFMTFGGTFKAVDITADLTGLTNIPSSVTTIQGLLTWINAHFFDGTLLNAHTLTGAALVTTLGTDDTTVPTSQAVKTYVDAQVASLAGTASSTYQTLNDVGYAKALARVTFMLYKDVGKVAFFGGAKPLSSGWIRCDGSLVDKSANPEYATLVDYLRGIAGADSTHPYIQSGAVLINTNQAYLPDLQDRYMKDVGTSANKLGAKVDGGIQQHTHTDTVGTSSSPQHTHPMPHTHTFSSNSGSANPTVQVVIPSHTHGAHVPQHTHKTRVTDAVTSFTGGHIIYGGWGNDYYGLHAVASNLDKQFQSGVELDPSGNVFPNPGTLPVTVDSASIGGGTLSGSSTPHSHTIPQSDQPNTADTGTNSPDNHTHTVTIDNAGTDTLNEVYNTTLMAYINFGVPANLM